MLAALWGDADGILGSDAAPAPAPDDPLPEIEGGQAGRVLARGRGRNRGRGQRQAAAGPRRSHEEIRNAIKVGRLRQEHRKAKAKLAARPSYAFHVAQNVFGVSGVDHADHMQQCARQFVQLDDQSFANIVVDRRHLLTNDISRGCVSHLLKQAEGLADWLWIEPLSADGQRRAALCTIVVNVFDDADMWARRPTGWKDQFAPITPSSKAATKELQLRGRKKHIPVLNLQETFLSIPFDYGTSDWRGLDLIQPAVPLPRANWMTVLSRWKAWSACNMSTRCGSKIDPNGVIMPALKSVAQSGDLIVCLAKDALSVNKCMERFLAAQAVRSHNTDCPVSLWPTVCYLHQAVLSMMPVLERVSGATTAMVRLGNIFCSSRAHDKIMVGVKKIADSIEFRRCMKLPDEALDWHEKARRVLELSKPALDISEDASEYVLQILNGDWSNDVPFHYHFPGCQCGGRREIRAASRKAFELVVGSGAPECQLYRMKGFEKAICYCFRGIKCHRVLPRAISGVHSQKEFNEAREALAAAAAAGDVNHAAASTVRLGKVGEWMNRDPDGRRVHECIVLNQSQQHFMNACFKAESLSRKLIDIACTVPADGGRRYRARGPRKPSRAIIETLFSAKMQGLVTSLQTL